MITKREKIIIKEWFKATNKETYDYSNEEINQIIRRNLK